MDRFERAYRTFVRCHHVVRHATTQQQLLDDVCRGAVEELAVTDDGAGTAPDVLPRIFEPFFSTKGEVGTGLGLSSVLRLVRDAGGNVTVESSPGRGARFTVFLPAE
jgi:signal transduction histidine kinase